MMKGKKSRFSHRLCGHRTVELAQTEAVLTAFSFYHLIGNQVPGLLEKKAFKSLSRMAIQPWSCLKKRKFEPDLQRFDIMKIK